MDHILDNKNEGVKDLVNEIKEVKYYSSRSREPLGRRMERNYEFPAQCTQNKFSFGAATKNSENSAKEVIFP